MYAMNYAAQARQQLLVDAAEEEARGRSMNSWIRREWAAKIERAMHYELPTEKLLSDAAANAIFDSSREVHLPYPVITVTARVLDSTMPTRTLLLVIAAQEDTPERTLQTAVLVYSLEFKRWVLLPVTRTLDARSWQTLFTGETSGFSTIPNLPEKPAFLRNAEIGSMVALAPLCWLLAALAQDKVIVQNVQTADHTINQKRERKGKIPLYTIKHLVLKIGTSKPPRANLGGHHASPAEHTRSAHDRVLPARGKRQQPLRVRVKACKVGCRANGFVAKDYRLEALPDSH